MGLATVQSSFSSSRLHGPLIPDQRSVKRISMVMPDATYWTSVLTDESDPGGSSRTHLWVSATDLHCEDLAGDRRVKAGAAGLSRAPCRS